MMKSFVIIMAACTVYNVSTTAQSILGECVNETLVLGDTCKARPQHRNFFKLLEDLIKQDTALIVLGLTFPDKGKNVRKPYRFDLVKTDLGQILLTLKSQMEFLTLDLPLLSEEVERQSMQLIQFPPGCLSNITLNDTLVKNWLLCGLTKTYDGKETLLIKKLCFARPYEEPGDWFLFKDIYYDVCSETPIKDSEWIKLSEDDLVFLAKRVLNFGVTIITIVCMIALTIYRRLFHTKARLFLCKMQNPKRKVCRLVKRFYVESDEIKLSPDKINFPALHFKMCNLTNCEGCKVNCRGSRRTDQWENITDKTELYHLDITGFWFDIGSEELISYNSFGLLSFLKASVEEISKAVCDWCKGCCCVSSLCTALHFLLHVLFFLIVTAGIIIPVFMFYKVDPFHTLLDGIVSLSIFFIVPLSMVVTRSILGFCRDEIINSTQMIILEVTFFFIAFFVVAILCRVVVILLIGLKLQSRANMYTLVSSTVFFVLANGYYQTQKTHKRYLAFLDMCMKAIMKLVDEKDTLKAPVFKNRVVPSNTRDDNWPTRKNNEKDNKGQKDKSLYLKMDSRIVLFYLPNGESAINRDFFLEICKADTSHSPGDLKLTALISLLKFIFWGIVVAGIIIAQHNVAKRFDRSLYSQAPGDIFAGLIPILFNSLLFPEQPKTENANLTRLLNEAGQKEKDPYRVTDLELKGKPIVYSDDQTADIWQQICIEQTPCTGCCCMYQELEEHTEDQTRRNEQSEEEVTVDIENRTEEKSSSNRGKLVNKGGATEGLTNPTFTSDSGKRV